jgi:hypothetical protein
MDNQFESGSNESFFSDDELSVQLFDYKQNLINQIIDSDKSLDQSICSVFRGD